MLFTGYRQRLSTRPTALTLIASARSDTLLIGSLSRRLRFCFQPVDDNCPDETAVRNLEKETSRPLGTGQWKLFQLRIGIQSDQLVNQQLRAIDRFMGDSR